MKAPIIHTKSVGGYDMAICLADISMVLVVPEEVKEWEQSMIWIRYSTQPFCLSRDEAVRIRALWCDWEEKSR